jgi:REP element-mobilizing transposase RayT
MARTTTFAIWVIVMNDDEPLAYFITWTVYGTWLQGDLRGWRRYRGGHELPQPRLAQWRRERLLHPVILMSDEHRRIVADEIERHCQRRGWHLWKANPRTNHVHVVVTAPGVNGAKVRDQFKANCTRGLRESDSRFVDRPVWTRGGDWDCINTEEGLEAVILYAGDAQDAVIVDEV